MCTILLRANRCDIQVQQCLPWVFPENYYNQFPVRYTRKQWPCPTSQSVLLDNHGNKPQSGPTSVVRTITPYYLHCYRRNYLVFPVDFRPLLLSGTPDTPSNIAWTLPAKFLTHDSYPLSFLFFTNYAKHPVSAAYTLLNGRGRCLSNICTSFNYVGGNYDNGDNRKSKAMYDAIANKAIKIAAQRVNQSKSGL